jgi:hypothetical protein
LAADPRWRPKPSSRHHTETPKCNNELYRLPGPVDSIDFIDSIDSIDFIDSIALAAPIARFQQLTLAATTFAVRPLQLGLCLWHPTVVVHTARQSINGKP